MLASSYYPSEFKNWPPHVYWLTGAATAILLFASVLCHELGHSFVALRFRVSVRSITLFIFGGVAQIGSEPLTAKAEFLIAIAGPITSLGLAMMSSMLQPALASVENLGLALFNLIPGFPPDGCRVFRAFVWAIGWYLDNAASAQVKQVVFQGLLAGHTVSQAMSTGCATISSDLTLHQLVDEHVLGAGRRCFLVRDGVSTVGLMTLHRIQEVTRKDWSNTTVAQAMLPLEELKRISPGTELWAALELLDRDGVNQLPVVNGSDVVGMLSRQDVVTYLRTLQDLGTHLSSGTSRRHAPA